MKRGFEHLIARSRHVPGEMRLSYASLCSVSNVFFFRETWQTFLQCFRHHQLVNGFDCWQFVVNATQISQSCVVRPTLNSLALAKRAVSLFSSRAAALVSRVSRLRRSRARALLSLNLKKKRDCSQSRIVQLEITLSSNLLFFVVFLLLLLLLLFFQFCLFLFIC